MVLPLGDLNPTRRLPVVTVLLIVANVGVFVGLMLPLSGCELIQFIYQWAAVPRELLTMEPVDPGAIPDRVYAECIAPVTEVKSVPLSVVTSMFLHGGILHLGLNMLFLWIFGNNVEDRLGHITYLLYYLAGGVVAAYAFSLIHTDSVIPMLGASGAIAAVLGGYLILYPRAIVHTFVPFPLYLLFFLIPRARTTAFLFFFAIQDVPAWAVLMVWFVLQVTGTEEATGAGIAYEAHIAGFLAGMLFTLILGGRPSSPRRARRDWQP
jgi:membrane associated rhomboid family serine protease